jgi:hypothetical protein
MRPRSLTNPNKTAKIPVTVVKGKITYFYDGEPLPLEEGWIGDLVIPVAAVSDKEWLKALEDEHEVQILPANTPLLIAMREQYVPNDLLDRLFEFDKGVRRHRFLFEHLEAQKATYRAEYMLDVKDWESFCCVDIVLLEPLRLLLRGTKQAILKRAPCAIPALGGKQVASVNHAYSVISEAFEPGRMSHTGNAFERARYQDDNGIWRPLRVLREREETKYEQQKLVGKHRTPHAAHRRARDEEPKLDI